MIIKTLTGNQIPELRLSGNNAKWVVKSTANGYRLKVNESTIDGKYDNFQASLKINYDLGLLTRFLKPIVDPFMGLLKRVALKIISKISIEIVQTSDGAKLESTKGEKALVVSYGKSDAKFSISGQEVLDIISRIKSGDCSIPELRYKVDLAGLSICSDHGDIMLHDVELRSGRTIYIGSALVEGKFYHNTIVDLWNEETIPSWLNDAAMDMLETTSDFYSY